MLSDHCYQTSGDDVIISIDDTISISGTVGLCLNGHVLEVKNIVVENGASFTLCDCSAGQSGKLILSPETSEGNVTGITVCSGGDYTQYGGDVELSRRGEDADWENIFGIYSNGGNVNLYGGSITTHCEYDSGEPGVFAVSLYGGRLTVTGAAITAAAEVKSGDTENDSPYACGIDLNDGASGEIGNVTVSASALGHWAGAAAVGNFSSEVTICNGTFNASAKGENSEAFGIYINEGKVNVKDGSFTVSTEGDRSETYGLYARNRDISAKNSIVVSDGSFSAKVKGEENELCVACGIYLDDSCKNTTAILSANASFHASAECLYSNAYAIFNECPNLSIMGGSFSAEAACTNNGSAYGIEDDAGISITGGSFRAVSGWSAYGASFDEDGGVLSGISASATAPHATAVFFSGDGSVTDCTLSATGTEDYVASALAIYNTFDPPFVSLSGGTLTAIGECSVGVEVNDGTVVLTSAPAISATQADFSIVPTDSSGNGWYTGGTVRLGDSFGEGSYTLSCETGLTGFAEGTVVVENVSAAKKGFFSLIPMKGRYEGWGLIHNAESNTLCIAPIIPPQIPSNPDTDSDPTYRVILPEETAGGKIEVRPKWAEAGDIVTLTVMPENGYLLTALDVTDVRGNKFEVTDKGNGVYTFQMPRRKVTVTATFVPRGRYVACLSRAVINMMLWQLEEIRTQIATMMLYLCENIVK
ncbi:MAG: hypothetical protein IJ486_10875 [Firmicutes bacterium]|nr:hypothetical protein [Bacillota bacterium]